MAKTGIAKLFRNGRSPAAPAPSPFIQDYYQSIHNLLDSGGPGIVTSTGGYCPCADRRTTRLCLMTAGAPSPHPRRSRMSLRMNPAITMARVATLGATGGAPFGWQLLRGANGFAPAPRCPLRPAGGSYRDHRGTMGPPGWKPGDTECLPAAGGSRVDRNFRFARCATAILAVYPARAGRPWHLAGEVSGEATERFGPNGLG